MGLEVNWNWGGIGLAWNWDGGRMGFGALLVAAGMELDWNWIGLALE